MYTNMSCQPTNLEKTTKVAGTTTAITAGLSAASTALSINDGLAHHPWNGRWGPKAKRTTPSSS